MVAGIRPLLCEQFHCVRIKFESYLIHYREEIWLMHFKSTPNACFQNCGHQKLTLPRGKFTAWLATVQVPCVISHHGSLGPQWRWWPGRDSEDVTPSPRSMGALEKHRLVLRRWWPSWKRVWKDATMCRPAYLPGREVRKPASPRQSWLDGHKEHGAFSIIKQIKRKIIIFTMAAKGLLKRRNCFNWFSFFL